MSLQPPCDALRPKYPHLSFQLLHRLLDLLQKPVDLRRHQQLNIGVFPLHPVRQGLQQSLLGTQLTVDLLKQPDEFVSSSAASTLVSKCFLKVL